MDSRRMKPQECPLYEDEIRSAAEGAVTVLVSTPDA